MIVNRKYFKIKLYLILIITLCSIPFSALFSEPLVLNSKMDNIRLNQYMTYFEDPSGRLKFNDIRNLSSDLFQNVTLDKINIGYTDKTLWYKIIINNVQPEPLTWIFESKYPLLDYITLYIPAESGYIETASGDMLPFSTMPLHHYNFISRITSPPGESEIYIKIKSEGSLFVMLRASDYESFLHNVVIEVSLLWLFYGIMIALFFYNSFIFVVSKDKTYLYLALFILSTITLIFIHHGFARKYMWPEMIWWGNYSHPLSLFLSAIFDIKFSQNFLNTKKNLKLTNYLLNALIVVSLLLGVISMFTSYSISTRLSVLVSIITCVALIFFTMIPMFWKNKRLAIYYSGSWFFLTVGILLLMFRSFGLIRVSFLSEWGYLLGLASGNIFLSIGVADKLDVLKKENEKYLSSLKESEERYRLFFETAHDAIMYCINDMPVFANRNMLKMTGYSSGDFYKKTAYDFFTSESGPAGDINSQIEQISSGKIPNTQFEALLVCRNDIKINVLVSISYLAAGSNRGIFMIISDISSLKNASNTIHKQYEKIQNQFNSLETLNSELVAAQSKLIMANTEVEKEKEFLSATLLSIGDGVITYDTEGKIFLMNKVAEEMTGVSSRDAIGSHVREVLRLIDDSSKDLFFDTLGKVTEKYRFNNIGVPFKMIDKEGNERIIEINSAIIKHENKPLGIVLALRDITIKSKIDTELIKMSKLESIGILAGGIAHDFNNLLTGISGNISVMKSQGTFTDEINETFQNVEKAVDRATALTKQLLTFAKGGEPILLPSSLKEIINESAKFIIKNPDIKCELNIQDDLKPVMIDPNQISQAINNLLINAVQAMSSSGKITIEAYNIEKAPEEIPLKTGSFVMLKISDTGCGIPKKNLVKIFDPFYSTKSNGTGLGLTSTYSIIKKHRGYIEVNSVENAGTTFTIYLKSAGVPVKKIESTVKTSGINNSGTVLIMDDENYILEILVKMLKHQGYAVDCAHNGEEAVRLYSEKLAQNQRYNHVILDLTVYGGMGGKETIVELKKMDPDVKAIVSSGYSDNPVMANYKEYGFTSVLTKPYAIDDVIKALSINE